jgi:hypothetical protein
VNLHTAAEAFCEALMQHARLCSADPGRPAEIVPAGDRLADAAGRYAELAAAHADDYVPFRRDNIEAAMGRATSNKETVREPHEEAQSREVAVFDKHFLRIDKPGDFISFAHSYLDTEVADLAEAVCLLCNQDGWKPQRYPAGLVAILAHDIDIRIR